ncbi:MAG: hypothetical protein NWF14_08950, partial [Candidatus Bathyarchaeota archaeon]|nr:hypothetical protein [Candidatus Bathyarchaeota archaeon]
KHNVTIDVMGRRTTRATRTALVMLTSRENAVNKHFLAKKRSLFNPEESAGTRSTFSFTLVFLTRIS